MLLNELEVIVSCSCFSQYKTAPHHKGYLEFEKVRLKQELEHSKSSESVRGGERREGGREGGREEGGN